MTKYKPFVFENVVLYGRNGNPLEKITIELPRKVLIPNDHMTTSEKVVDLLEIARAMGIIRREYFN